MSNSLEFAVEDFFIRLFNSDPRSAGRTPCHFDEDSDAETKSIVIKATQGATNLAAFGGYNLEVQIEYRSPGKTSRAEDDLTAAMLTTIVYDRSLVNQAALQVIRAAAGLADINIPDESTGDRQNTADLRKRSITLPVQARLP